MSRSRQIAINAVTQWGVTGLSAVLGLLVVPFLIQKLGKDGYGLVVVILAIAGVCSLADLGISGALTRQLAEALAKRDDTEFNQYISTAAAVNLFAGVICAGVVFALAAPMARLFAIPEPLFVDGVMLLRVFGAAYLLLAFLMFVPKAVLASHNRYDLACIIDAVRRLLQSIGLFAVLTLTSLGLVGWALVCIAVDVICVVLLWRSAFHVHPEMRVRVAWFASRRLKSLMGLGGRLTILQISCQLSTNADPFILSACLGPASLSLYRPPAQVLAAVSPLIFTLATQLNPLATQAHVRRDTAEMTKILYKGTKYTMLVGVVASAILMSLANPLCNIWLGSALGEQYRVCATILIMHAVAQLSAYAAAGTQGTILIGMRRLEFFTNGRLALAVVNVITSWMLVRYTHLGVLGAVIPTMVIEVIWRPMLAWYTCREIGVAPSEYFTQSYAGPLLIGGVIAIVGLSLSVSTSVDSVLALGRAALALTITAISAVWVLGLNSSERAAAYALVRSFVYRHRQDTT